MDVRHVLVVDDDPGIRQVITMLLEEEGYTVSSMVMAWKPWTG